jgi:hypothetical protein
MMFGVDIRKLWRRLFSILKRGLRIDMRLSPDDDKRELYLANAILDHGRMLQSYLQSNFRQSLGAVLVEVPELAFRFRETNEAVEKALLRLKNMGLADPYDQYGCWMLNLMCTIRKSNDDEGTALSA